MSTSPDVSVDPSIGATPNLEHANVHIVDGSEKDEDDSSRFQFEGTYEGTVIVRRAEEDGANTGGEPPSATDQVSDANPYEIEVTLGDGRSAKRRFSAGDRYEWVFPSSVRFVYGRPEAFVVIVGERAGEDCVEVRLRAYVFEPRPTSLKIVAWGIVGFARNAFDACGDEPSFRFSAEDERVRVHRTLFRLAAVDPPTSEERSALRDLQAGLREVRATYAARRADARAHGATAEERRALEAAFEHDMTETRQFYAFDTGRPWILCGFPRMQDACDDLPDLEDTFVLGDRPPALR